MLKFNKWQKSENYLALLAEERAKSDSECIAKILTKKNTQALALSTQEPADSAPLPSRQPSSKRHSPDG